MKQYRKIDIYTKQGQFIATTTQAKSCREAVKRFLEVYKTVPPMRVIAKYAVQVPKAKSK